MLTHRFDDALALASRLHRSQIRKGSGIPYVAHLLGVTALVLEYGGDEDQAIAALLHDAVEDQGGLRTLARIEALYGARVAAMVRACSDNDGSAELPWKSRKLAYLDGIAAKSDDAILVTACDKLHNATAILEDLRRVGPQVFDRFTAGRDGTLWYYAALVAALRPRAPASLGARLQRTVAAIQAEA